MGVLTNRIQQEEDGWRDESGDPGDKRRAHGAGNSRTCLLERKHQGSSTPSTGWVRADDASTDW
jgi:hypothetical protein